MTDMTRIRCCLIALGVACLSATGLVLANEPEKTLLEVQGTVLVTNGKHWEKGYTGMRLQPNVRIATMGRSSAAVKDPRGVTPLGAYSLFTPGQSVQQFAYSQTFKRGRGSARSEATRHEAKRDERRDERRKPSWRTDRDEEEEEEEEDKCPGNKRHGERCPISPDR